MLVHRASSTKGTFSKAWLIIVATLGIGALAAVDVHYHSGRSATSTRSATARLSGVPTATQLLAPAAVARSPRIVAAISLSCVSDMIEVTGNYCPDPEEICEDYISEKRDRCERFRTTVRCIGKPEPKNYCIDRFEYPNELGRWPLVAVTWDDAHELCSKEGKRLCTEEEWTLACEGPERKPYPFGYTRDATACNFDKPYIMPNNFAFDDPHTRSAEIARVSQSEPSGSRARCVSDYGVYDLTGNVDEWVFNGHGSPKGPEFRSGLKGGYWGPVRNRCRPMTTDHNQWHRGYQIGFRCCNDVRGTVPVTPIGGARIADSELNDGNSSLMNEPNLS